MRKTGCFLGGVLLLLTTKDVMATPVALTMPALGIVHQTAITVSHGAESLQRFPETMRPHETLQRLGDRLARDCLALAIYHEARGERTSGQFAVAQVILNRVRSRVYPRSICAVVYQNAHRRNRCQFSFACDGRSDYPFDRTAWEKMQKVAAAVLCREDCGGKQAAQVNRDMLEATHYHAVQVAPSWAKRLRRVGRIGRHLFLACERTLARMDALPRSDTRNPLPDP